MIPSAKFTVISRSAADTQVIGHRLGSLLKKGDTVLFLANLGAGKTTFIQGLARAFGFDQGVLSPTFVLAQTFPGRIPLHHLDFYRLSSKEILAMGACDYLIGGGEIERGAVLIEWAERCRGLWPADRLEVRIRIQSGSQDRRIQISGQGPRSEKLAGLLRKKIK